MASSRKSRECKRYPSELIAEAVRLVKSGSKQAEVVKELDVPESTLRGWLVAAGIEPKFRSRKSSVESTDSGVSTVSSSSSPFSPREEDHAGAANLLHFHQIAWQEYIKDIQLARRIRA